MTHLFQTACLLGLAFLTSLPLRATDTETLSPDKSIRVTLSCPADGPTGFSVNYQDKEVFRHINLGLQTDRRAWEKGLTLRSASEATLHTDDYTLLSGKRLHHPFHGHGHAHGVIMHPVGLKPQTGNPCLLFHNHRDGIQIGADHIGDRSPHQGDKGRMKFPGSFHQIPDKFVIVAHDRLRLGDRR